MKKEILLLVFILLSLRISVFSQGVGINDSGAAPNPSAGLDVDFTNKGLLIPRITQAQRDLISSPAASLLIYQTDNTQGYYYNSGTPSSPTWTQLITSASIGWSLTGNASIVAGTNFLGTTDAQNVVFKTNNSERMRILSGGNIGIGITSPSETLHILGRMKMQDSYGKTTTIETISNSVGNGLTKISANGTNSINFVVGDAFNDNFKVGTSNNTSYFRDKLAIGDISFGATSAYLSVTPSSSGGIQTALFQDLTATTGKTKVIFKAGAGDTFGDKQFSVQTSGGSEVFTVDAANSFITVKDVLTLTPRASAPASPIKGMMYFDNTTNKLMVYDGTMWQACW